MWSAMVLNFLLTPASRTPPPTGTRVPWHIAGTMRSTAHFRTVSHTRGLRDLPSAVHFHLQQAYYYEIPWRPPGVGQSSPAVFHLSARPGQTVAAREIAWNPTQHTAWIKVGIPTDPVNLPSPGVTAAMPVPPPGGSGTSYITGAYCETGWNDIFGITVGIVWNYVNFAYNGLSVSDYHTWSQHRAPFPDGDIFLMAQPGQQATSQSIRGTTLAVEDAPAFQNTQILWADNVVTGYANGRVTGSAQTWAWGPDKNLLGGWWQIVHN